MKRKIQKLNKGKTKDAAETQARTRIAKKTEQQNEGLTRGNTTSKLTNRRGKDTDLRHVETKRGENICIV